MKYLSILALACGLLTQTLSAQEACTGLSMDWGGTAGLNIGATAPLPIPEQITKVHAWYPNTNGVIGLWGRMRFGASPFGLLFGLESERKAFSATTSAVNLPIQMPGFEDLDEMTFTGLQNTDIQTSYLTLPLTATFATASERLVLQLGMYHSLLLSGSFRVKIDGDGTISDLPIAPGRILNFDFSDYVGAYDFGLRLGAEYFFTSRVGIAARFNFGVRPALKEEFRAIPSRMHHMYGMIGASYRFGA